MKHVLTITTLFSLLVFFCSCEGDNKAKEFIKQYIEAVNNGDKKMVENLYPGASAADSLASAFVWDDVKITDQDSLYLVSLGEGVDFKLRKSDDKMEIIESHGLFAYPKNLIDFAKKTGQWKEGLNDVEQAKRMADHGLEDYLFETYNQKIKEGLRIAETGTYGDDYYEGEWVSSEGETFTIQNGSPFDIPGDAYNIVYKSGYWGGGEMSSETVPGKDVKAGEKVELRTSKLGPNTESETTHKLVVNGVTRDVFLANFHPIGNEYEEYLKREDNRPAHKAESLEFILEGQMGGCGTRIGFYGKSGYLMYSPNSSKLTVGSTTERSLSLISYDPATAQLVLKVTRQDGTTTGKLVGTYKDGQYIGFFNNVSGKSSPFSFE